MRPVFLVLLIFTGVWAWQELSAHHELRLVEETAHLRAQNVALATRLYGLDDVDPETGETYIRGIIERAVQIEGVRWDDREVDAMVRLCWRESRYNPTLQNPRSSAYGLWQFLDSTWKSYGIEKTSDPLMQTIAAVRYIEARYKTPRRALAFHLVAREVNGEYQHYY